MRRYLRVVYRPGSFEDSIEKPTDDAHCFDRDAGLGVKSDTREAIACIVIVRRDQIAQKWTSYHEAQY